MYFSVTLNVHICAIVARLANSVFSNDLYACWCMECIMMDGTYDTKHTPYRHHDNADLDVQTWIRGLLRLASNSGIVDHNNSNIIIQNYTAI